MNNKERILKYLSDQMNQPERKIFEEELRSKTELKAEFDKYNSLIDDFVDETKFDEDSPYFNSLLPKVRIKIDEKKSSIKYLLIPAFSFAITIIIVLLLNFPNRQSNSGENYFTDIEFLSIVDNADSSELNELFDRNFISDYAFYQSGDYAGLIELGSDDDYDSDELSESSFDYIDAESDIYDEISESDAEIIFEELINKKIL